MSNDEKTPDKLPRKMVLPDGTVFTAYGVTTRTKAPPPIKPLSGCGVSPAPKPAPTTHKPAVPVDWAFWPASRRVTRDEAIALSLGLDPHSLYGRGGIINPEYCPDNAMAILFLKRMNLLAACNSRTNIPLSEIASWAVSICLSPIPPEIEAIASAAKSKETRARVVAKVSAGDTATGGCAWTEKAKEIADVIGLKRYETGIRQITARNICVDVATELEKDETTWGLQGPRSSSNVRNHGLRGWKFTSPKGAK